MKPTRLAAVVLAVAVAAGGVVWTSAHAQDRQRSAVCIDVPQDAARVDTPAIQNWMNAQLDAGKNRFVPVRGVSTTLCAW